MMNSNIDNHHFEWLDSEIKYRPKGWFKRWCEEKGVEYNSHKQKLYRYRQSKVTPSVTEKVTLTDFIELAQKELENDPHNAEYGNFIRRAMGKDQYLIRTAIKLFNNLNR